MNLETAKRVYKIVCIINDREHDIDVFIGRVNFDKQQLKEDTNGLEKNVNEKAKLVDELKKIT